MTSTSRIGWVLFLIVSTVGVCYHCFYKGLDFEAGLLIWGSFLSGQKAWDKLLWYKNGAKQDEIQKEANSN